MLFIIKMVFDIRKHVVGSYDFMLNIDSCLFISVIDNANNKSYNTQISHKDFKQQYSQFGDFSNFIEIVDSSVAGKCDLCTLEIEHCDSDLLLKLVAKIPLLKHFNIAIICQEPEKKDDIALVERVAALEKSLVSRTYDISYLTERVIELEEKILGDKN